MLFRDGLDAAFQPKSKLLEFTQISQSSDCTVSAHERRFRVQQVLALRLSGKGRFGDD